jgi:hypothetical protein
MLDLIAVAGLVREKTSGSFATEVKTKPTFRRDQPRRAAIRSRSATALRGLADRIEPSHTNPIAG